ncbi:MFS transporter [Actinomadura sp. 21ATH]|uniref:MFS transporter n=1 Tax=Actinomadura sp. 21ATH TaxID=1735444 RepID=UPI0035C17723
MTARGRGRGALAGLCLVEFLSWGVLYYTLPIAATRITGATSWPAPVVPAVYTVSLLCAAACGPWAGRLTDRYGPRAVIAAGAAAGAAAMGLSAATPHLPVFVLAWMLAGAAQACTLYPVAFAAATQWFGTSRAWPLTVITLAGGVSSTVFAPVTAALVDSLGWRAAVAVLAAGYGPVATGTALALLTPRWERPRRTGAEHEEHVNGIARSREFRDTRLALALAAAGLYAVTLNMMPLLEELGFGYAQAAAVFGLVGAGQLLGRLVFLPLSGRGTPRSRTVAQVTATALALGLVTAVSAPAALVAAAAVLAGAVRGSHTLSTATAVSDRWGRDSYATVFGRFNLLIAVAAALGPALGALVAEGLGSYRATALVFTATALAAVAVARRT